MKSNISELRGRGYIGESDWISYRHFPEASLRKLLDSKIAVERTVAVRLLYEKSGLTRENVLLFCQRLAQEKSLYCRLEISRCLERAHPEAAKLLLPWLGRIENRQYQSLPESVSKKMSYLLPRDPVARILGKAQLPILPVLMRFFIEKMEGKWEEGEKEALREVIDAVGFLCFYHSFSEKERIFQDLERSFLREGERDEVIRWKLVQAFSAFPLRQALVRLKEVCYTCAEPVLIRREAERGLLILRQRCSDLL